LESENLEDLIKKFDSNNTYNVIKNFHEQVTSAIQIGKSISLKNINVTKIKNIVITGLGGSAIGGDLIKLFTKDILNLPVIVNRDYFLPKFVNEETLVIISSYSGNTEETISAYQDAIDKGSQIICISNGGTIKKIAEEKNHNIVLIPGDFQPRFALGYMFFSQLYILIKLGFIKEDTLNLDELITLLKNKSALYSNYSSDNFALSLAKKIKGKFTFIYSTPNTEIIGIRWRGQLNENSKVLVSTHYFPELNHNEIVGWTKEGGLSNILENSLIIFLKDKNDFDRVLYRTKVTRDIFENITKEIVEISGEGNTYLTRIFDLLYLADWCSYYLALLNGVDPADIKNIVTLKEKLAEYK